MPQTLAWHGAYALVPHCKSVPALWLKNLLTIAEIATCCRKLASSNSKFTASKHTEAVQGTFTHYWGRAEAGSFTVSGSLYSFQWTVNLAPRVGVYACRDNKDLHCELRQLPEHDLCKDTHTLHNVVCELHQMQIGHTLCRCDLNDRRSVTNTADTMSATGT